MVQKEAKRPRGRPRAYDPEQALEQALQAFWRAGFSATSLDQISAATGMNRPSLYAAFGDKHALYLALLQRYTALSDASIAAGLARQEPLAAALARFYRHALASYLPAEGAARGCFLIGTATSEAMADAAIREQLGRALQGFTAALERRLRRARAEGELAADADTAGLADVAAAVLHSLAVRARAGDTRAALNATAQAAVKLICGTPPPARRPRRRP
jgi:AcrR family transcriptional regulator